MHKEPPVHVNAKPYTGHDPKKRALYHAKVQAAAKLEQYLADRYKEGSPQSLTYFEIARETGIDLGTVKELLFAARGGHNGITI